MANRFAIRAILTTLLSVCTLLATPASLKAHRFQTVLTTIEHNERSGMMEVIHRVSVHDITHILTREMHQDGGLDSLKTRAALALQLSKDFQIAITDEKPLVLELVGAEVDAGEFFIYQELAVEQIPSSLTIRHDMLRSKWSDLTSYVNVHYPEGVRSLIITGSAGAQKITASR